MKLKDFLYRRSLWEPPPRPEITLDTVKKTPEENARRILDYLRQWVSCA